MQSCKGLPAQVRGAGGRLCSPCFCGLHFCIVAVLLLAYLNCWRIPTVRCRAMPASLWLIPLVTDADTDPSNQLCRLKPDYLRSQEM